MKKFIALAFLLCAVMISSTASAARGIVAFNDQSSHKVFIATQMEFTCGRVMSVPVWLSRGDTVAGDLESFGTREMYNLTDNEDFSLWADKYWATQAKRWIGSNVDINRYKF